MFSEENQMNHGAADADACSGSGPAGRAGISAGDQDLPGGGRMGTFGRVRWSLRHCGIALGVIVGFKVAFFLFGFLRESRFVLWAGMPLWLLMFAWMIAFPLWLARHGGLLHRPRWRRVLKEFGVAVPVVVCLFVLQGLVVFALQRVFGPIEGGKTYDPLRGAPGSALLYWFLIPALTIGPVASFR
jgi:hypothetical protein